MDGLNERQLSAVTAPMGHLLILAGAGSGKTRVLVSRIAWLVEHAQVSIHSILAVTFTNKAAGEMKSRLRELLSMSMEGLWVGTFHGLCHRLLRRHHEAAGLPAEFHILDSEDQARLLKRVILSLQLDVEQWSVKQAQTFINHQKDEGLRPSHVQVLSYGPGRTLLAIYRAYEAACQTAGVVDFAELMLRSFELLRDNPSLLAQYQERFQAILVDEFQDTNTIQYAWIKLLAGNTASVMVVGDDDQSIYGWRGAKIENIQKFTRDFEQSKLIRLEQNYRSTATILEAANFLITHNASRMGKELWTAGGRGEKILVYGAFNELDEARFVSERITLAIGKGCSPEEIAILYRSNAQSRVIEEALLHAGVRYRMHGGVRFFERAEVKDALAYLRLLANPLDDLAFERVVNFPTRGIGEKTMDELRSLARLETLSLWEASGKLLDADALPQRAAQALSQFKALILRLQAHIESLPLDEVVSDVIKMSGLQAYFQKEKGEKAESRIENLQELVSAAKQFRYDQDDGKDTSLLVAFLAHASLEAGEMQAETHESAVVMMTLHAAKGLEFEQVMMVGMEEGLFPSRQSIEDGKRLEEERRLCYVGMTRAKKKLVLSYADVRRIYGREEYHRPSRFLKELPRELLEDVRIKPSFQTHSKVRDQSSEFQLGQNVQHPVFGAGVILAVEGSGAHTRIQVQFAEHGSKWLVLAYAKLEFL